MPSEELARIIHVSDFHLFVDALGNDDDARARSALVKLAVGAAQQNCAPAWFRALVRGFNTHSRQTLDAFLATLSALVRDVQTGKKVVVQTGDVEAFGWLRRGAFRGFDYWASKRQQLKDGSEFVDIYGNHDVWPGTLPGADPLSADVVELLLLQRPEFADLLPDKTVVRTTTCLLEFYRVNTIRSGFVANTMAYGRIAADRRITGRDVYPHSRSNDPFMELAALARDHQTTTLPIVRILVMHHPPHFFHASASVKDLAEGPLENGNELQGVLTTRRFHLLLAGHRHRVDPSPGVQLTPTEYGRPQAPLPNTTVQLVAGTATQMIEDTEHERPSFNTYVLILQRPSMTLEVSRIVYRHPNPSYDQFQAGRAEIVASGIPLV